MIGGGARPKTKPAVAPVEGGVTTDTSRAYKGTVVDIFKQPPQDVTAKKSKFAVFSQVEATMEPTVIVSGRDRNFMDITELWFEYEMEFYKNDGTTKCAATDLVFPANLIGHTAIQQFEVTVNNTPVAISSDKYHLEAYMDRFLNYSKEDKDTTLTMEGWYSDTPGKFDNVTLGQVPQMAAMATNGSPTADELRTYVTRCLKEGHDGNYGAEARRKVCINGNKVKWVIRPAVAMFNGSKRYLPPGMEIKFKIRWNPSNLVLMAGNTVGVTAPTFKIVPYSPKIYVKQVEINDELHLQMENKMLMEQNIAVYPHFGSRIVTHTITNGRRRVEMNNIFQGYCPNYMIVGFVRGDAFHGNYARNPFNFQDLNQSSVRVTKDGEELPLQRLDVDQTADRIDGFNTLACLLQGKGINAAPIGLSRSDYKDGNYLLAYNFNPDGEQNYNYEYARNSGNVNLVADFSQDTADNTTVIVFGYFEQQAWVDGNKNLTLKYSY